MGEGSAGSSKLRLVLSPAAMVVSAVGAVVFTLLALPQFLVVVLALFAALALIDVAGRSPGCRRSRVRAFKDPGNALG